MSPGSASLSACRGIAMVIIAGAALAAPAIGAAQPIEVKEIGSFHIGGRKVRLENLPKRDLFFTDSARTPLKVDLNGDYQVEQMYVQYTKLANPRARYPLLMIHGGGLTGVTYETTPDGRPGFQMLFLRKGHDVYVSDAVERGRASFAPPEIWKSEPFYSVADPRWELMRVGPPGSYSADVDKRRPYPNVRFPVASYDQLMKQNVPRWVTNNASTQAAYDQYVQKVCPCVVMAHSTGGPFGLQMALNAPDKVKGLILLEPAGAPAITDESVAKLSKIPVLYVWADNRDDEPSLKTTIPLARGWQDALTKAGSPPTWLDLPEKGIHGNTHMMMMDDNNADIAGMIQQWVESKGLMK